MSQADAATKTKQQVKLPTMWHVVLHNDDFTPFDFVIELLVVLFNKSVEEGAQIAGHVHAKGRAIVGIYTREIAQTKVADAARLANDYGHPLLITAEPA